MTVLTSRGRLVLLAAVALYLLGWSFGMREAVPVAIGLALACAFAAIWVRLAVRPMELLRALPSGRVEGSTVEVEVELRPSGGVLPARATLVDDAGRLGPQTCETRRRGEVLRGAYLLRDLPRGRYLLQGAALLVEDPFGLERVEVPLEREDALSVYPRIVQLDSLFSEGGPLGGHDRRLLLSRVSGYDLHGVRDHVRGESLRAVHWKTSARLRKLMVKEFEDTPRDEAVVLLDAHAGTVLGTAPASSFETQVRATGSLLRRIAQAGQRASLVIAGERLQRQRLTSLEHDWPAALELLAAVQPDGIRPLASALGESAELDAARVWIVTARLDRALAEAIAILVAARRDVAVVFVDADSWRSGAETPDGRHELREQLAGLGVPVCRVSRGDDLRERLSVPPEPVEGGARAPSLA
jgi:uncharacterized protein (DUF58 family)